MVQLNRTEIILNNLKSRFDQTKLIGDSLRSVPIEKRNYKGFYYEIAFFVHTIMNLDETRRIFINLVRFKEEMRQSARYKEMVKSIEETIHSFAIKVQSSTDYQEVLGNITGKYNHPLEWEKTLSASDLLKTFESLKLPDGEIEDVLNKIAGTAEHILKNFPNQSIPNINAILEDVNAIHDSVNQIKYYNRFAYDYSGAASATELAFIYSVLHPNMYVKQDMFQMVKEGNIMGGKMIKGDLSIEVLLNDCDKVFQNIKGQLHSRLAIELYVDRFTTYVSLYYTLDFKSNKSEIELQRKFQEFLFNVGYFPISEMELKDGRLDTIAASHSDAFLFEIKQFGLGTKKESDSNLKLKVKSAQVQSSIYVDRLRVYPNLAHIVFIIIFSNRKITYKNNEDRVEIDGIQYVLKCITVFDKTPSKVGSSTEIDINDLIKR